MSNHSASTATLLIDFTRLMSLAGAKRADFLKAAPFPHIVIDSFLPQHAAERVAAEFPPPDAPLDWRKQYITNEDQVVQANKLGFSDESQLGPSLRQLFWELNSARCLLFLERLTAIDHLLPDPHLFGGGIHQSLPGAVLAVHADFTRHPKFNLARRLNLLVFLNADWRDEWGGALELWSRDMTQCIQRIAPVFNRCVIFATGPETYHGHPIAIQCPDGTTRKSLALYYYTNDGAEKGDEQPVRTAWQRRPTDPAPPAARRSWRAAIATALIHPIRTWERLTKGRADS